MKVSYSVVKGKASSHCITWTYRKKRHRKFFRDRISAMRFLYQKETELGLKKDAKIENEIIFLVLGEIKERLDQLDLKMERLEQSFLLQEKILDELRKPPAPKILKVSEASKVLRVSTRKLYYLLDKGVFKRYKLPHTRSTFIKLEEVEKALGSGSISELLD